MTARLLVENNRVFFPSTNINIFPCSRRGQYDEEAPNPKFYDPEARLNTERTNRLHTAVNGFTDSFIVSYTNNKLIFVLKGYYIEVKDFNPSDIVSALSEETNQIYAHLSLHTGISLNVEDYCTEILYRQRADGARLKYLDVPHEGTDFFVGVSFTADQSAEDTVTDGVGQAIPYFLPLFSKDNNNTWQLIQTSLLPKIEHGDSEDFVKIPGGLTVTGHAQFNTLEVNTTITVPNVEATHIKPKQDSGINNTLTIDATTINATENINTKDITVDNIKAKEINTNKITQNNNSVPAIKLETFSDPERYRLQIILDGSKSE